MHPFSRVPLKPSRAASRESAREAGGRTQSPGGRAVQPPSAEHLLCAGHWDTHPFNAGRASLLHITYPPSKPRPGFKLKLHNHSSLQPGPFPGARQPGLRRSRPRACLTNTRLPTSQNTALSPLSPHAPLSCCRPLGGSCHLQVGGQAPRADAGPSSAPTAFVYTTAGSWGHVWSVCRPHGVCPGSRDGTCAHVPPGTTSVQVGWLQPPACLFCTCRCLNH